MNYSMLCAKMVMMYCTRDHLESCKSFIRQDPIKSIFHGEQNNKVFALIPKILRQENTHIISVYRILQAGKPKWHLAGPYTNKRSGSGPPLPNRKKKINIQTQILKYSKTNWL